jgi:hypothetical protein
MITNNDNHGTRPTAAPTENDEPEPVVTGRDGTDGATGVTIHVA